MHPLMITLTFLTLLTALFTSKVKEFIGARSSSILYSNYAKYQKEIEEERVATLLFERECSDAAPEDTTRPSPAKRGQRRSTPSLGINLSRPPNHARLNMALIVNKENDFLKEIAARLIHNLYGEHPLFKKHPHLEYKILNALIGQKEKMTSFVYPDELATLQFDDPLIAQSFYLMMKGGQDGEVIFPSFLYYITFDAHVQRNQKKINFLFASDELFEAIFDDTHLAKKMIDLKQMWWDMIFYQEAHRKGMEKGETYNRSMISDIVESSFETEMRAHHRDKKVYTELFDFSFSHEGSVLIVKDPITKISTREIVPVVFQSTPAS